MSIFDTLIFIGGFYLGQKKGQHDTIEQLQQQQMLLEMQHLRNQVAALQANQPAQLPAPTQTAQEINITPVIKDSNVYF